MLNDIRYAAALIAVLPIGSLHACGSADSQAPAAFYTSLVVKVMADDGAALSGASVTVRILSPSDPSRVEGTHAGQTDSAGEYAVHRSDALATPEVTYPVEVSVVAPDHTLLSPVTVQDSIRYFSKYPAPDTTRVQVRLRTK